MNVLVLLPMLGLECESSSWETVESQVWMGGSPSTLLKAHDLLFHIQGPLSLLSAFHLQWERYSYTMYKKGELRSRAFGTEPKLSRCAFPVSANLEALRVSTPLARRSSASFAGSPAIPVFPPPYIPANRDQGWKHKRLDVHPISSLPYVK